MQKLLAHKKHLIIITSVLAILGLTLSLFADTAGGAANNHNKHVPANSSAAVYEAAGVAAGSDAVNTGFRASALAADFVQPSSGSPAPTATNTTSQPSPSGQPTNPTDGDDGGNSGGQQVPDPTPTPVPPTKPPCACPTPKFPGEGTMIACPDSCISPTPVCPPCGGYRKAQTGDAIMCPMMMCAE